MSRPLEQIFGELFAHLEQARYSWQPLTPDRLLECRNEGEAYPVLERFFGLGLDVSREELLETGLRPELADDVLSLRPAVSRRGSYFVVHSHWPAKPSVDYVYLGEESFELLKNLGPHLEKFEGSRVLDLGSGSGALLFDLSSRIEKGLGFDSSKTAVEWSQAAAIAQGLKNLSFSAVSVGSSEAESAVPGEPWDIAVMNPPFAIPIATESRPHRDGGELGIALPLVFLQFAARHLKRGGQVFTLVTNPIVHGRSAFFDRLDKKTWERLGMKCLHDHFNHALYRKERYAERGIQRVELWFLHLSRRA